MDYSCRDIPMKLNVRYQPLNFDIYLSQVIDIPRTTLDEAPYNFQLEIEAIDRVDKILEQIRKRDECMKEKTNIKCNSVTTVNECSLNNIAPTNSNSKTELPIPSCPIETPLTPIKSTLESINSNLTVQQSIGESNVHRVNPKDFEDMHYNPFDHLELQTIDELRELDLVFQASYANQSNSNNQLQPTTSENSMKQDKSKAITES